MDQNLKANRNWKAKINNNNDEIEGKRIIGEEFKRCNALWRIVRRTDLRRRHRQPPWVWTVFFLETELRWRFAWLVKQIWRCGVFRQILWWVLVDLVMVVAELGSGAVVPDWSLWWLGELAGGYVVGAEEITGDGSACRRVVVEDTGRESTEKKEGRSRFDVRRCTIKLYT